MSDNPLVALVLYAYNEARFVEEAVRSLFAQDYPDLEIVLSDDGSTDGTWEIMQRLAAEYTGPHRVLLNHNEHNIGIGSQINAAVAMTTGELIMLANADDASHPDRASRVAEVWRSREPHATAVWSAIRQIDEHGNARGWPMPLDIDLTTLAGAVRARFGGPQAASLALDRRVFDAFGPLPANLILEDNPLFGRAVLLGRVEHITEPLVDYRVHADNISQTYNVADFGTWCARNRKRQIWQRDQGVKAFIEILRDLHQRPADNWEPGDMAQARWAGMEKVLENAIARDYYANDRRVSDGVRLRSLLRLAVLIGKNRIKRWFPFIRRRNDRWHYRHMLHAAKAHD